MSEGFRPDTGPEEPIIKNEEVSESTTTRRNVLRTAALALAARFGLGQQEVVAEEMVEGTIDLERIKKSGVYSVLEEEKIVNEDTEIIIEEYNKEKDEEETPPDEVLESTVLDNECGVPMVRKIPERQELGSITLYCSPEVRRDPNLSQSVLYTHTVLRALGFSVSDIIVTTQREFARREGNTAVANLGLVLVDASSGERTQLVGPVTQTRALYFGAMSDSAPAERVGATSRENSVVRLRKGFDLNITTSGLMHEIQHVLGGHDHGHGGLEHFVSTRAPSEILPYGLIEGVYERFGRRYRPTEEQYYAAYGITQNNRKLSTKPKPKSTSKPQPKSRRSFLGGIKK